METTQTSNEWNKMRNAQLKEKKMQTKCIMHKTKKRKMTENKKRGFKK